MQISDIIFPFLFPAGYFLGLYLGKQQGALRERRQQLVNFYGEAKRKLTDGGFLMRGEPIKLTFDHEPSQEEIQQAINKITINGVPQMPINKDAAIKSEFESSEIYKTIKDLDNDK